MKNYKKLIIALLIFSILIYPLNFAEGYELNQPKDKLVEEGIKYLSRVQNNDGGFPAKEGRKSSLSSTCWVIMALTAGGEDLEDDKWKPLTKGPIDYLLNTDNELEETTEYARILLTLSALNKGTIYKGKDLKKSIKSFQQENGHFAQLGKGEESLINSHIWSILALASTKTEIPNKEKAKEWLISSQNDDGGFGWYVGGESDSDDTCIAIQALIILGEKPKTSSTIGKALEFIKARQGKDGGFSSSGMMGKDSNVASDAWVLQSLIAAEEDYNLSKWKYGNKSVEDHLMSLQSKEGSFNWEEGVSASPVDMTAYAITALSGKPYPVNIDYLNINMTDDMFSDLSKEHWAYSEISKLVEQNIISGYPDGSFKPEKLVSREEFTSMIVKGFNLKDKYYGNNLKFGDVSEEDWSYKYIKIAYKNDIIKGRSNKEFDPLGLITGGELATILANSIPDYKKTSFEEGPNWYSKNVEIAKEFNLLYPSFNAKSNATRAECAYTIQKIIDFKVNE